MSQTPPTPPILRLPPELLERVFSFLAPCDNERYWDSVEPVPDCVIRFFTGWKHTCQAARLTCRDFSRAETLRKALFHTLYWFPTNNSLERMKSIVEKYPNLVHTFSWFGPVFGYWDPDIHSYRGQLEGEFESKKAIGGLGLSEMFTPYQRADVGAGFIALEHEAEHQFFILESEHTTVKLARAFASSPHLTKFTYNGSWDLSLGAVSNTASRPRDLAFPERHRQLARIYADVLIEEAPVGQIHHPHVGAYSKIVNAMWACGKRPTDFTISSQTSSLDVRSTFRQTPDLREMRRVSMESYDSTVCSKIKKAFEQNSSLLRNVRELTLGNNNEYFASPAILQALTELNSLWLRIQSWEVASLIQVFKMLPKLTSLRLENFILTVEGEVQQPWRQVFTALREGPVKHCEIHDLAYEYGAEDEKFYLPGLLDEEMVTKMKSQIQKYVQGNGDWTDELSVTFKGDWEK